MGGWASASDELPAAKRRDATNVSRKRNQRAQDVTVSQLLDVDKSSTNCSKIMITYGIGLIPDSTNDISFSV